MRLCGPLARPLTHQIQQAAAVLQAAPSTATAASGSSNTPECATSSSPEHAARLESSLHCSTSTHTPGLLIQVHQQVRSYAKKAGGGGGKAAAKPAVAAAAETPGAAADPLAPPELRLQHVPRVYKGDPVAKLTGPQKALLEELTPSRGPLRSLRQLNWDLGPEGTLALMHEQLSDVVGVNTQVTPIFTPDSFQSAAGLAAMVQTFVEEGKGMPRVEQAMLTAIASMPDVPFEGIKIQLKGRMSGKGGKASKKVWVWGRTGRNTVDDPVDYAHEAVVTRAGYIGIKVWVKYKRSHMPPQHYRIAKSAVSVSDLLAMPPITALPSRSSSAWWNRPVTWQPQQHRAWDCFRQGYDPLTGTWQRQQLEQRAQQALTGAAAGEADVPHTS